MTDNGGIKADVDVRVAVIDGYLEDKLKASDHAPPPEAAGFSGL